MLSIILAVVKTFVCKTTKFIFSIKLLIVMRFLTGYYYNFGKNIIIERLADIYCVSINIFLISHYLLVYRGTRDLLYFCLLIDRCLLISISFYTKQHFTDYITDMERVSAAVGWKFMDVERTESKVLSCMLFAKVSLVFVMNVRFQNSHFTWILYNSSDFLYITVILMLDLFSYRINLLRLSAERFWQNMDDVYGNSRLKLVKIKKLIHVYQNLYNNIESSFNVLKFMVFVKFTINFRRIMSIAYVILSTLKLKEDVGHLSLLCIDIMTTSMISFMAPLLIEQAADELDKTKVILANQLLACTEAEVREALQDALTYLRTRPFRCVVCRALPVDASAPLALLSLVTNNLVVMLQFMKPKVET